MTPVWNESLWGAVGRFGLVLVVVFALLVLSSVPFQIAHLGEIRPAFMLMAVYYWTILRPPLLPPVAVFALGIILDLLSAWPLGLSALVLVAAQWLTRSQRKFLLGQPFPVIWAGFTLLAFGAGMFQWGLFSLFSLALVAAKPMFISVALSAFLFPVIALPLHMVHKALADQPLAGP
jgi:rod shape-determining protein MreD